MKAWGATQNKTARIKGERKGREGGTQTIGKRHGVLHRIRQLELKEASKRREGTSQTIVLWEGGGEIGHGVLQRIRQLELKEGRKGTEESKYTIIQGDVRQGEWCSTE